MSGEWRFVPGLPQHLLQQSHHGHSSSSSSSAVTSSSSPQSQSQSQPQSQPYAFGFGGHLNQSQGLIHSATTTSTSPHQLGRSAALRAQAQVSPSLSSEGHPRAFSPLRKRPGGVHAPEIQPPPKQRRLTPSPTPPVLRPLHSHSHTQPKTQSHPLTLPSLTGSPRSLSPASSARSSPRGLGLGPARSLASSGSGSHPRRAPLGSSSAFASVRHRSTLSYPLPPTSQGPLPMPNSSSSTSITGTRVRVSPYHSPQFQSRFASSPRGVHGSPSSRPKSSSSYPHRRAASTDADSRAGRSGRSSKSSRSRSPPPSAEASVSGSEHAWPNSEAEASAAGGGGLALSEDEWRLGDQLVDDELSSRHSHSHSDYYSDSHSEHSAYNASLEISPPFESADSMLGLERSPNGNVNNGNNSDQDQDQDQDDEDDFAAGLGLGDLGDPMLLDEGDDLSARPMTPIAEEPKEEGMQDDNDNENENETHSREDKEDNEEEDEDDEDEEYQGEVIQIVDNPDADVVDLEAQRERDDFNNNLSNNNHNHNYDHNNYNSNQNYIQNNNPNHQPRNERDVIVLDDDDDKGHDRSVDSSSRLMSQLKDTDPPLEAEVEIVSAAPPPRPPSPLGMVEANTPASPLSPLRIVNTPPLITVHVRSPIPLARPPSAISAQHRPLSPIPASASRRSAPVAALTVRLMETYRKVAAVFHAMQRAESEALKKHASYYAVTLGERLGSRYEVVEFLGKGSFGQVVKARVLGVPGEAYVAIKIIRKSGPFLNQGRREVTLLQLLKEHRDPQRSFIVDVLEDFMHEGHLCIVFELLSHSLLDLVNFTQQGAQTPSAAPPRRPGLSLRMVHKLAHQLLCVLAQLGTLQIIHCDIKPENVALTSPNKAHVKLLDFGSACYAWENVTRLYPYIQSRYYRAPEILLGCAFSFPIDMWSLGCVLVELYTARPLFAGRDSAEQLYAIMDVLGPPPPALLSEAYFLRRYFRLDAVDNTLHPKKRYRWRGLRLEQLVAQGAKDDDAATPFLSEFLDLVARMLSYDPAQRITPLQALQHNFIVTGPATRRAPQQPPPTVTLPPPIRNPFAVADYGPGATTAMDLSAPGRPNSNSNSNPNQQMQFYSNNNQKGTASLKGSSSSSTASSSTSYDSTPSLGFGNSAPPSSTPNNNSAGFYPRGSHVPPQQSQQPFALHAQDLAAGALPPSSQHRL